MRLYLDTEFNGWGGQLISLALVPSEGKSFYEVVEMNEQLDVWVRRNVIPFLCKAPVSHNQFQLNLTKYINQWEEIEIVADWPDDIKYFCDSLIAGPGFAIDTPHITFILDRSIDAQGKIPHNALSDAEAIKRFCENRGKQ